MMVLSTTVDQAHLGDLIVTLDTSIGPCRFAIPEATAESLYHQLRIQLRMQTTPQDQPRWRWVESEPQEANRA